jgi:hypothetical protein
VGCVSSNLVAHTLGWQNGNIINNTLVGVEIDGEASVVLLDNSTSTLLYGLCTNTLEKRERKMVREYSCLLEQLPLAAGKNQEVALKSAICHPNIPSFTNPKHNQLLFLPATFKHICIRTILVFDS